jgi:hypothetical protein
MLNVPQEIRNQLARTGRMQYPKFESIFKLESEEKADLELLKLARKQAGVRLATAWIYSAPLLLENEAIAALVLTNPSLKLLLPEILTVEEAVLVAQADSGLSATLAVQLASKLRLPLH